MKEITIYIKIVDDKIATAVKKNGYENSVSSIFEFVGTLDNAITTIKHDELNKLKVFGKHTE